MREQRKWWAVTDTGVREVVGYSCALVWWCPEEGCSMTEGHHLFTTEKEGLRKAIAETKEEIADLKAHLKKLQKQSKEAA